MQSQTKLMELRELMEPTEQRELMDEVLDIYVEREVAWLKVHPTLIQGQRWSNQWEAM